MNRLNIQRLEYTSKLGEFTLLPLLFLGVIDPKNTVFVAVYGNWETMLVKLLIEGLHISPSSLCGREMQSQHTTATDGGSANNAGAKTGVITPLE